MESSLIQKVRVFLTHNNIEKLKGMLNENESISDVLNKLIDEA